MFPTIFEEILLSFEQRQHQDATMTEGWGPIMTMTSTHTGSQEIIHGSSVEFVMRDYPAAFPDRVAIHRKGARPDAAGVIFLEFPAGAGPQMATFIHTFLHLPGALPRVPPPTREALQAEPIRSHEDGVISFEFYAHDWTFARQNSHRNSQITNSVVHVVATGDPSEGTASLTIRRPSDPCTKSIFDLKNAQVTVANGAYDKPAMLLTIQSVDSAGVNTTFTRHLHALRGLHNDNDCGPPVRQLVTVVSQALLCANAPSLGVPPPMQVDQGAKAPARTPVRALSRRLRGCPRRKNSPSKRPFPPSRSLPLWASSASSSSGTAIRRRSTLPCGARKA